MREVWSVSFNLGKSWLPVAFAAIGAVALWFPRLIFGAGPRPGSADRTLSTTTTFVHKYPLPAIWIGGFGWGTLQLWLHPADVVFNGVRGGATRHDQLSFLAIWIVTTPLVVAWARWLKRVRLTPDGMLLVSNYLTEVAIPPSDVERVTQNWWLGTRPVVIHLRHESPFGRSIAFIPGGFRRTFFGREDYVVAELRELAGLEQDDASSASDRRIRNR
ncbi:MAG TPA: hypothetical protein VNS52_00840 [Gemmatimonadaceae bacterium]|nr:hypothetical protein [Gemmatimonadaceae bacterium]